MTPEALLAWLPVVTRYGALLGIAHQAIFEQFDRPTLLALYGAMLGLSEIGSAMSKAGRAGSGSDKDG